MDLLNLAAKITLDDSSYTKGINNAEKLGQQMQSKLSAMTIAAGNIATDLLRKGAQAVQNIIGGAVDGYADYQQLVGGVETLFKSSSKKVQEYASQSYKTTGLSANKYMETVTSFSASLLQGLGGNTELAADLANTAITDMADNANKMGTDISSIQTAYQGFAKQNYTMLDNLKLGYGGTKEEMVRLINDSGILDKKIKNLDGITFDQLVLAIHEIQTEMGITGTTAEEAAETISGSKASLKAAWQDMLSAAGGMSDADFDAALANFKTAFSTYMENFVPSLVLSINSSGSLVKAVAEAVADLPTDLLSEVADAGVEAGTGAVSGLSKITSWLVESIANMFKSASADPTQIADLGVAIGDFIGTAISDIVTNAPAILEGIVNVGVALAGGLVEGLFKGLFGEGAEVDEITDGLQDNLSNINFENAKASALITYMDSLIAKYGEAASGTEEWKSAQAELESVLPEAGQVFEDYGEDIGGAVATLKELNSEMQKAAIMNALAKATSDENALLATQTLEYNKARLSAERNQFVMEDTRGSVINAIQSTAAAKALEMEQNGGPAGAGQTDYYNKLVSLSEGMSHVGDRMTELSELDFDELRDALNFLGDTTFTDDELEAKRALYEESKSNLESAQKEMDAAQKEMDATKQAISETNAAMTATVEQLLGSGANAGTAVDTFATAVNAATAAIAGAAGTGDYTPHATGMDYVPYDGYRAELHRGERIVPAGENRRASSGGDFSGLDDRIVAAIQAGMANARVEATIDGRKITEEVNRNNMRELKAARYSG